MSANHQISQPALRYEATTKQYSKVAAVNRLSLTVQSGELFGFLGLNGAGKTTAMKLAAGLVKPSYGRVLITEYDVQVNPRQAKSLVGYVPDSPYIYDSLTGREFMHFCAGLYQLGHEQTVSRVAILFDKFGIGSWADKRAGEYSHGMKQRVVMASAFLHNPKVILIDEPMVGLDPGGIRLVKKVLREFCAEGGAVFLSTHTLYDAEELCDRVGIIHKGNLISHGTLDEVRTNGRKLEDVFLELTSGEHGL